LAIKLFQDGGFGGATAALSEPYANAPETQGLLVMAQEELNRRAREIHEAGLRISIHAIGDAAIRSVLDAIDYALGVTAHTDRRHRIEHCGLPLPPIPERIKALGVVPVLQPPFLWFDGDVYMDRVGPERSRWLYPVRTLLEAGLPVAGSSDGPVVPDVSPLLGVSVAVTRRSRAGRVVSAEEAVDLDTALSLYTSRAAFACGEEDIKGTITPGKLADLVVLAEDPFKIDPADLPAIPIDMTIVNGAVRLT
jgi:predicted amidohydrolase YtcJ